MAPNGPGEVGGAAAYSLGPERKVSGAGGRLKLAYHLLRRGCVLGCKDVSTVELRLEALRSELPQPGGPRPPHGIGTY